MTEVDAPLDLSIAHHMTQERSRALLDLLTSRESEALLGLARFKTRKEVARDMEISETRVGQLVANAKRKMGVPTRQQATLVFFIARSQCGLEAFPEKQLRQSNQVIDKFVLDGRVEELHDMLVSNEFRQFVRDHRSTGPKAWTALLGPEWKIAAGVLGAVVILMALILAVDAGSALDRLFQ